MTAGPLNAEILRNMSIVVEDEALMKQLAKYLRKLVAKKQDPTLMTKEDFFAKIEASEREIAEGKGIEMLPDETLDDFLRRVG